MDDLIEFEFEGVRYVAPMSFAEVEACVLPDGRVVRTPVFFETVPPKPDGLCVSEEPAAGLPLATVAA